jgi:hypothetical protein
MTYDLSSVLMKDIEPKPSKTESVTSLLKQRGRVLKGLPPLEEVLRGSLLKREIRCGKPRCRCATGSGHILLCVTVSIPGGRTQQVTVPPELADTIRGWTLNYRRYWQAIEDVSAINRKLLKLRQIPADIPSRIHKGARKKPRERRR